jgi:hypothetical protein
MDILAGMLAYVAGLGALFGALAVAFFVFAAGPKEPQQTQAQPQGASAMLVRPSTANKPAVEGRAKRGPRETSGHSAKGATAASSPASTAPSSHEARRKPAATSAQARRQIQEEQARRWAYQQDSNFGHRFLGYSD